MTYFLIFIAIFSLLQYLDETPWYKVIGDVIGLLVSGFIGLVFIFHWLG